MRKQAALLVQTTTKLYLVYRIVGAPLWAAPQITGTATLGGFICGARSCDSEGFTLSFAVWIMHSPRMVRAAEHHRRIFAHRRLSLMGRLSSFATRAFHDRPLAKRGIYDEMVSRSSFCRYVKITPSALEAPNDLDSGSVWAPLCRTLPLRKEEAHRKYELARLTSEPVFAR
jgi:hypothetical protein